MGPTNKKVYIATFINALNYGAVLQAYALGQYIKSLGYEVQYLGMQNAPKISTPSGILKKIFFKLVAKKRIEKKRDAFCAFKDKYCSAPICVNGESILVCGSDQIWNIEITKGFDNCFFGQGFKKAISYAASCGEVDTLKKHKTEFKTKLDNFTALSTRERDLSDFIVSLSGKECPVVCDPTMLIVKDDYAKLEKITTKEKYLLIYQMNKSDYLYKVAKHIAKKKFLKIIEINNNLYDYKFHGHKTYYSCSPEKFLSLIKNASFIVTNSFHGTVFSLIYEKPFTVVKSQSRNSRIVELCERFSVENKIIDTGAALDSIDLSPIDYDVIERKMYCFAEESKQYLSISLKKMEENDVQQ